MVNVIFVMYMLIMDKVGGGVDWWDWVILVGLIILHITTLRNQQLAREAYEKLNRGMEEEANIAELKRQMNENKD